MPDFTAARLNMVEGQVRPNKVTDPGLIAAMSSIPRELFVPAPARPIAYVDEDVPVGGGRHLIEPMVLARLLQEARVTPKDIGLVVAAGTGYAVAVMSRLAATVVGVESSGDLVRSATRVLDELQVENYALFEGPAPGGYPGQAPYDVILIDGAVADVPQALFDQLGEGGRLVTVVAPQGRFGQARLYERRAGVVSGRTLFDAGTPLLPEFVPVPKFQF